MEKSKRKLSNTIKVTPGPRQSKRTKLLQYGTNKGDIVKSFFRPANDVVATACFHFFLHLHCCVAKSSSVAAVLN